MLQLILAIVECRYPDNVQDELLKDQYIFWSMHKRNPRSSTWRDSCQRYPREMLTSSLIKWNPKSNRGNCLGLKLQSHMTQFRLIGVEENLKVRVKAEVDPPIIFAIANIVERATTKAIVLPLGKSVVNVAKTIISRLSVNP